MISFSGIDGAGKSTQIEKLCSHLQSSGVEVLSLTFWDNVAIMPRLRASFSRRILHSDGAIGTPQHPAQRRDKNARLWPLLVARCGLYLLDVWSLRRILRRLKSENNRVVIFDRYVYDQLAALPLESALARKFAAFVLSLTPRPKLRYLLDAVPEAARARKPEYPLEFVRENRNSYLRLRKLIDLRLIAPAETEDVHLAILEILNRSLPVPNRESAETSAVTV